MNDLNGFEALNTGAMVAAGFGGILWIVGAILAYVAVSYGIYLLARKFAPHLHPVLSWIPVVNLYPLLVVAEISPWWMFGILAAFIPVLGGLLVLAGTIFVYHRVSLRSGRGVGTTILLVFFSCIMLPWLGRYVHGHTRTPAWIIGVAAYACIVVGSIVAMASLATQFMDPAFQAQIADSPYVQEAFSEAINDPEIQAQIEALRNNPEAMKAPEEQAANNPMIQKMLEQVKN